MERKGSEKQLSPCLQVCGGLLLQKASQPAPGEEALPLEKLGAIAVANPGLDLSRNFLKARLVDVVTGQMAKCKWARCLLSLRLFLGTVTHLTRVTSICPGELGLRGLWENPLEKEMAAHSSTLAWKISWTEESSGLQSMGSQRVRHHWVTNTYLLT